MPITDEEILAFITRTDEAYPPEANAASAVDNRRFYDAMCARFAVPRPEGLIVRDGVLEHVPVRTYQPSGGFSRPAILYVHGGGYVVGSLDSHDDICAHLAVMTGFEVVAVAYRLAPEHAYPAALDDVALVWQAMTAALKPVIGVGDSAGASLIAALSHRMKRLGGPMPLGQVLIYPGLGGDGTAPSYTENAEAPMLRTADLSHYSNAYSGGADVMREAEFSPLQAEDFSDLPPSFVVTADVDPLRDDGRDYVAALNQAGGEAVWRNEPQLVHGFLRARLMSQRAGASVQAIIAAVKDFAARLEE